MESENLLVSQIEQILKLKGSPLHQQSAIMLSSLVEASTVPETSLPTYLFASLFALLRKNLGSLDKQSQIESGLLLMSLLIPRIPVAVIQSKYPEINELVKKIEEAFVAAKSEEIDKYSANILLNLLPVIPLSDWSSETVKSIVASILLKLVSGKARLRKLIIKNFSVLLSKSEGLSSKLDSYIREFALKCLENEGREALLITFFLNPLLNRLRVSSIGDLVYAYQKLLTKATDEDLITHTYLTLENVQHKNPLSYDLSEGLLKELLNNQPSFYSDQKLVFSYIQCLVQTLIHMLDAHFPSAKRFLSGVLSVISEVLLVDNRGLQSFAEKTMELVLLKGMRRGLWTDAGADIAHLENFEDLLDLEGGQGNANIPDFKKVVAVMSHLTSGRYEKVFPLVLKVLVCFFERLEDLSHSSLPAPLQRLLEGLLELRNQVPREMFRKSLEKITGKIGLRKILEIQPLSIDQDCLAEDFEEKSGLWILSSLGKGAKNENIEVFFTHFYPLICKILEKTTASHDKMRNQVLLAIVNQIWGLLAGFQLEFKSTGALEVQLRKVLELLAEVLEKNNEVALVSVLRFISTQKSSSIIAKTQIDLAEKIIPKLVKFVNFPHKTEISRFSLKSIGFLSYFCSKSYLDRVFKKNGDKLLEPSIQTDVKTFEILLEIAQNVEIRSDKQELSIGLIRKFLVSQSAMQKRAYKLLSLLFDRLHSSFFEVLCSLANIKHEVQPASRPARLAVIIKVWNAQVVLKASSENIGSFLQAFLSEIVLGLKETNRRSRELATKILKDIHREMISYGVEKEFLSMLTAGFAGVSGTMKAATILAFTEVIGLNLAKESREILELIDLVMKEGNKEIFSAGLELYRRLVKKLGIEDLKRIAEGMFKSILEADDVNREKYKSRINFFLRKVIKRLGKEEVTKSLPESHRPLVKAAIKAQKTEKKREKLRKLEAKELKSQRREAQAQADMEEENQQSLDRQADYDEEVKKLQKKRLIEDNPNDLLLKYDAETEKFHFIEHPLAKVKAKIEQEEEKTKKMELELLKGKIVVKEMKEETGKKRKREENEPSSLQQDSHAGKKSKNSKGTHIIKESGETFKAKNSSHGDLLLPGKPNPYAFIQLNPKVLNKRHRNVAGKAFDEVLGKKKEEGALKGLKSSKKLKI